MFVSLFVYLHQFCIFRVKFVHVVADPFGSFVYLDLLSPCGGMDLSIDKLGLGPFHGYGKKSKNTVYHNNARQLHFNIYNCTF